jgi:hypothetical protein
MQDVNVSNDLRQLSLGQVKTLEYSRYDINGYRFRMPKLEVSHPHAATTNSGLVTSGKVATGHVTNYYGILRNIVEYTFGGAKELKVVFFQCDWFDPINSTRVDEVGMVEVKHKSRYSGSNLLLVHQAQQVYCLSYPHPSFKNWWVVYKVRPKMHTRRYDEYVEGHEDDDIYQEEIAVHQNFMVSDGTGLTELDTGDVELLDEEASPSKKRLQKSKRLLERQERRERLDARVAEADSDADDFWYVNYLLLL